MTRTHAHLGFAIAAVVATLAGGWLWAEWGAVALLNGFTAICG